MGAVPRRRGFIDYGRLAAEAGAVCRRLGLDVALDRPVQSLPLGQRQMVEIAKALYRRPRVLILDEPTSSLTAHEVAHARSASCASCGGRAWRSSTSRTA